MKSQDACDPKVKVMDEIEITDELVSEYLDGQMPANLRADFEKFLASDPELAAQVASLQDNGRSIRDLPKLTLADSFSKQLLNSTAFSKEFLNSTKQLESQKNRSDLSGSTNVFRKRSYKAAFAAIATLAALVIGILAAPNVYESSDSTRIASRSKVAETKVELDESPAEQILERLKKVDSPKDLTIETNRSFKARNELVEEEKQIGNKSNLAQGALIELDSEEDRVTERFDLEVGRTTSKSAARFVDPSKQAGSTKIKEMELAQRSREFAAPHDEAPPTQNKAELTAGQDVKTRSTFSSPIQNKAVSIGNFIDIQIPNKPDVILQFQETLEGQFDNRFVGVAETKLDSTTPLQIDPSESTQAFLLNATSVEINEFIRQCEKLGTVSGFGTTNSLNYFDSLDSRVVIGQTDGIDAASDNTSRSSAGGRNDASDELRFAREQAGLGRGGSSNVLRENVQQSDAEPTRKGLVQQLARNSNWNQDRKTPTAPESFGARRESQSGEWNPKKSMGNSNLETRIVPESDDQAMNYFLLLRIEQGAASKTETPSKSP